MKVRIYDLIQINRDFILSGYIKNISSRYIKEIVMAINNEGKVIISGIDFIGKTDSIKNIIAKTNISEKVLFFDKKIDIENTIRSGEDLKIYINEYLKLYKNIKYIILGNIGEIENVKYIIRDILKTNYKIIIIGNDIKVDSIKNIEIKQKIKDYDKKILKYGGLRFIDNNENEQNIRKEVSLIKDKIILDNIFDLKSVKDIDSYYSTISFLSNIDNFKSVRELYKNFSKIENLAVKTFNDYLDFSQHSKIIEKIYLYDIKKQKEITTKSRFFFLDNGILNSLNYFRQKEILLIKNLVFIKLYYYNFNIYGGRNGNFEFDFYIKSTKGKNIAIHISYEQKYKKYISKLSKLEKTKKYLIIENIEKINIRKTKYDDLEIISLKDFIEKDLI